jgi:hypothetical protein
MFFWARLTTGSSSFRLRRNVSIGIEAAYGAVAFAEDASAFFDEGFDLVDKFFFIELVFGCAVGFFDMLEREKNHVLVESHRQER